MGKGVFLVRVLVGVSISLCFLPLVSTNAENQHTVSVFKYTSPSYLIDRKFRSMEGPEAQEKISLLPNSSLHELLWITAVRTEMVADDGSTPMPPELMCHATVDYNPIEHGQKLEWKKVGRPRIFLLSQGVLELRFPPGFGLPVYSDEIFNINTQVLNHNFEHPNLKVRQKVTFEFVRNSDLKEPIKPLFATAGGGMKLLEGTDGCWMMAPNSNPEKQGAGCSLGIHTPNAGNQNIYMDTYGRKFTGHWVVKPGREVNHTNVTKFLNIPFDTTLHYANVHLHPYAESLELRDITADKTIFKSHIRNQENRIGISFADFFSSQEGVPVYKDHEYELISVYNNTSGVDQDAMVTTIAYLLDKEFKQSSPTFKISEKKLTYVPSRR